MPKKLVSTFGVTLTVVAVILLVGSLVKPAIAIVPAPGDIVVATREFGGTVPVVIAVDPMTGEKTLISSGGSFVSPQGITITPSGVIYVSDLDAFGGAIFRVDPSTGGQTVVSAGGNLSNPLEMAVDSDGFILVANLVDDGAGRVLQIDPITGAQVTISSGGDLDSPTGIALDSTGDIFVADPGARSVFRIDPITGAQTAISSGGDFRQPFGITLDDNDVRAGTRRARCCDRYGSIDPDPIPGCAWAGAAVRLQVGREGRHAGLRREAGSRSPPSCTHGEHRTDPARGQPLGGQWLRLLPRRTRDRRLRAQARRVSARPALRAGRGTYGVARHPAGRKSPPSGHAELRRHSERRRFRGAPRLCHRAGLEAL